MKMDILHAGVDDALDVLSADMMDALCGGDERCERNYRTENTSCKLGYEAKDDGSVKCQRRYRRTE